MHEVMYGKGSHMTWLLGGSGHVISLCLGGATYLRICNILLSDIMIFSFTYSSN